MSAKRTMVQNLVAGRWEKKNNGIQQHQKHVLTIQNKLTLQMPRNWVAQKRELKQALALLSSAPWQENTPSSTDFKVAKTEMIKRLSSRMYCTSAQRWYPSMRLSQWWLFFNFIHFIPGVDEAADLVYLHHQIASEPAFFGFAVWTHVFCGPTKTTLAVESHN